jgi:phosphate acetyltransferase
MDKITEIKQLLTTATPQRIVFPEGDEATIQAVASTLIAEKLAQPILIFETKDQIPTNLNPQIQVVVMAELEKKPFIDEFLSIRKEKAD